MKKLIETYEKALIRIAYTVRTGQQCSKIAKKALDKAEEEKEVIENRKKREQEEARKYLDQGEL
jgi:hypothetical protein